VWAAVAYRAFLPASSAIDKGAIAPAAVPSRKTISLASRRPPRAAPAERGAGAQVNVAMLLKDLPPHLRRSLLHSRGAPPAAAPAAHGPAPPANAAPASASPTPLSSAGGAATPPPPSGTDASAAAAVAAVDAAAVVAAAATPPRRRGKGGQGGAGGRGSGGAGSSRSELAQPLLDRGAPDA